MQSLNGTLIFSATDLSNFLACRQLTLLSRRTALGGPKPRQFDDPALEVLRQRGIEHEQGFLVRLRDGVERRIADLKSFAEGPPGLERYQRHAQATADAMRAGVDVIYQGFLFDGTWLGYPDFLCKTARPSALGDWSYEVVDAKLAREARGGALLQVLLYADLLKSVQGVAPAFVRLALGGAEAEPVEFRVKDYAAYFRAVRRRFLDWVAGAGDAVPLAPDPVPHCDICDWEYDCCTPQRREVDHLCFVAGITRQQRSVLVAGGVATLEALGDLDMATAPRLDGITPAALARVQAQARIQLQGRRQGKSIYELLAVVLDQGLAALPAPSPGDLFLDLEGDPYAFEQGIEFLFGVVDAEGVYTGRWSLDRVAERAAFEWFMDMVMERLERFPDLHIYHYAAYEPTALKRLAGRYDTRIDELDRLLRGKVFVDLYRVVRQGLRASVESYSIKKMEPFYGFERAVDLRKATRALAHFEAWLELGASGDEGRPLLDVIQGYNQDDCVSTLKLREWLETLRPGMPRPTAPEAEPPETLTEKLMAVRALMGRLLAGVPEAAEERTPEQQGRWLVAQLLEYHRREDKSMWWRYFNWVEMNEEELIADGAALGGLEYLGVVREVKQSLVHRYRFPAQDHQLGPGKKGHDPRTRDDAGAILALDEARSTIDLKRGKKNPAPHPRALILYEHVPDAVLRESLLRLGSLVADRGFEAAGSHRAAVDLILARSPRAGQRPSESLIRQGGTALDGAIRLVAALDHSVLPIQGPPGSGKTYTGARMILAELVRGRKVGVTATSHKVISNLLQEVCRAGGDVRGIQKADEEDWCGVDAIERTDSNAHVLEALSSGGVRLAAGTAWLWSREEMAGAVDVLFIDEAGQFSLANALAVAPAATNLVLLGDPRQLQQPQQGLHPPGTDVSALDHLLAGETTMPADRGLFLDLTWRLHPEICAFTSEVYYDDRLRSVAGLEKQRVTGTEAVTGSGLRWAPVEHSGNANESPEEAATITALVKALLASRPRWTTGEGKEKPLGLNDILVVAPYNAQVAAIEQALPPGARVGTVDRFQGQEAPIVIYSMASSSAEDAPRGMEFLYSPNRLNVATSRARCLVILVANRQLFFPECRTPEQMRLANGLCRYLELVGGAS